MPPKRRRILDDSAAQVLENDDLCALVFAHVHFRERLSVMSCVSRAWNTRVYTSPGAWSGPISLKFVEHIPRSLRWLAATRDATLILSRHIDLQELRRVLDSGTSVSAR